MNVVIYARYSSDKQTDQSIEGQLKVCRAYAEQQGYVVVGEYADPAMTGKKDNRPKFQEMIRDSKQKLFQGVLVYSLDRFSRDKYDNAIYKKILKDNGVRVLSAQEKITDDSSGMLLEGVLETLSQFYSMELADKVKRGMRINAQKGKSTGGTIAFGYKSVNKELVIDEEKAPYVRKIFEMYADGCRAVDIIEYLNAHNIRTASGVQFNRNSLHSILKNKKYIGIVQYGELEIPDKVPRILSDELFYSVAEIMERNKKNAGHNKAKTEYLLTTKLFCGHCRAPMVGVSAKSKTGRIYYYYSCNTARLKACHKKNTRKELIEDLVIKKCRELLTDENIKKIAVEVAAACNRVQDKGQLSLLQRKLREADKAITNLLRALETGQNIDLISEQITKRRQDKELLEKEIVVEKRKLVTLSEMDVRFFLTQLKNGDANDIKYRRALIKIFVNSIYLFDDRLTIIFNAGDEPVTVDGILLDEIAESNEGAKGLYSDACGSPENANPIGVGVFCTQRGLEDLKSALPGAGRSRGLDRANPLFSPKAKMQTSPRRVTQSNFSLSNCLPVGATIGRPPQIAAQFVDFPQENKFIAFGVFLLFHKMTGRSMIAPTMGSANCSPNPNFSSISPPSCPSDTG